jgi:hypothetical protein
MSSSYFVCSLLSPHMSSLSSNLKGRGACKRVGGRVDIDRTAGVERGGSMERERV